MAAKTDDNWKSAARVRCALNCGIKMQRSEDGTEVGTPWHKSVPARIEAIEA